MAIGVGEKLPDFDLPTSAGGRVSRKDLAGGRTVLYFYPKDDTSGCTLEAREFTALLGDFGAKGVRVLGVSPDSAASHDRFTKKCDIGFPLVSDPDKELATALGVWVEKSMYGRSYMGIERSTFLVGADGKVVREWRKVKASGHARQVLESL
jgi:thioredoxin-dependent peroxiredoxin